MSNAQYFLGKAGLMMFLNEARLNRSVAAKMAGISRMHFYRLMRRYRVSAPVSQAKLTTEKVRKIRARLGNEPRRIVAQSLGVHTRTIDRIANYETWYKY